jgi:hypothetical protein
MQTVKRWASLAFNRSLVCLLAAATLTVACAARVNSNTLVPAELVARAERGESVRVIIELHGGPDAVQTTQDRVIQEISGTQYRVTRRYKAVPILALEVSAEALHRLMQSKLVRKIQEDRSVHPQEKTP